MAAEIQVDHVSTAKTLYALVRNATGSVWQTTTSTFVAYASASLANFILSMTEQGTASRHYTGTFPAAAAGTYAVTAFERVGGSAAEGDTVAGTGNIEWDGTAVIPLYSRLAPTVAGQTLDISAGGEAGIDWANIGSPTTEVELAGTAVLNLLGGVGGGIGGSVLGSIVGSVLGSVGSLAVQAKTDVRSAVGLGSANLDTQLDALPTNAELATALGTADDAVLAQVATVKAKTDLIPASPAAVGSAMTLTSGERTAIADEVEAQIIDETDSEKVLTAITDKIASVNPDLSGLTLSAIASSVWSNGTRVLTAGTNIVLAKGTGVTGFNDLSAAQVNAEADAALADVGLSAIITGRIDVASSTLATAANLAALPTANAIADQVWDEILSGHAVVGSAGAALTAAGSAGDPWATPLPGAYGAGTAGQIIGDGLATLLTRIGSAVTITGGKVAVDADAIFDLANGVETGFTPRQAMRIILSVLAGKLAGADSTTVTMRDVNDTKTRVTATVTPAGNRTAVTLDVT